MTELGVCQWFHYEDYRGVELAARTLRELGIRHLRTGVSWADFHRPRGQDWYRWMLETLAEFDVLLSVWHTPPSISEGGTCASPPRRLEDYGDFIGQLIREYGRHFGALELWNEPNNRLKWDFRRFDPDWSKFAKMIAHAGRVARGYGRRSVLGGLIPVDRHWLELMGRHGGLEDIDVVAIHGFPHMWWDHAPNWDWYQHWRGWPDKIETARRASGRPVWITETGLATWDLQAARPGRQKLQARLLREAAQAPCERVYWYSLIDLSAAREAIEGFHVDENEYHLGLVTEDGRRKEAFYVMQELLRQQERGARRPAPPEVRDGTIG